MSAYENPQNPSPEKEDRACRRKEAAHIIGVSVSTTYNYEERGLLPPSRRIGPNASGWLRSELTEFLRSRPRESCLDTSAVENLRVARERARSERKKEKAGSE